MANSTDIGFIAEFGQYGHDFIAAAGSAPAWVSEYFCIEAWGGDATVTYDIINPDGSEETKTDIVIADGRQVFGRIPADGISSVAGATILCYRRNNDKTT